MQCHAAPPLAPFHPSTQVPKVLLNTVHIQLIPWSPYQLIQVPNTYQLKNSSHDHSHTSGAIHSNTQVPMYSMQSIINSSQGRTSGAIHSGVPPALPLDTYVCCRTVDRPKSAILMRHAPSTRMLGDLRSCGVMVWQDGFAVKTLPTTVCWGGSGAARHMLGDLRSCRVGDGMAG